MHSERSVIRQLDFRKEAKCRDFPDTQSPSPDWKHAIDSTKFK